MDVVSIGVAYECRISNRGSNIMLISLHMHKSLYTKDLTVEQRLTYNTHIGFFFFFSHSYTV